MWSREAVVIPNGIESRLVKKKNVIELVKMAPRLIESHPDLVFNIIGDGPERRRIEQEIRVLGLGRASTCWASYLSRRSTGAC